VAARNLPLSASSGDEALAGGLRTPIRTRAIDRIAYASDASHFLLTPTAVAVASDVDEVAALLRRASTSGTPLTFRSGGTSLSGQASTDGILVDTRREFRRIDVLDGGMRVRVQPGATVRQVNIRLARHSYRLGPDPASEVACTIGGVVANNSSGMACGIDENTYQSLESMIFVLPSGTVHDTAAPDADLRLRDLEPELHAGMLRLTRRVREQPASVSMIRRQFAMKNTMGYGVNAFLDFEHPIDVLAHLIIGSEGTLAFVAEATFRTVPIRRHISTALAIFPSLVDATGALPQLVATGAATLELMDSTSIRIGQSLKHPPTQIRGIDVTAQAALLIEYQADSSDGLAELTAGGARLLSELPLVTPAALSDDAQARALSWKFRKGLYALVAGARPSGTTALLEDVVVPVPALADTCAELQVLFDRHGYQDSVIFGHAKDGNVHFMLTDRFEGREAMDRFAVFTDDMVELILDAGGNLKAEHGTGRAMAPFVRRQYGDELYEVMREIKRLCDPAGILNPGVLINDDPVVHLTHVKAPDSVEEEVDRCVECGYCEPVCPSRDLTLTPRQRIVVRRAQAAAERAGDIVLARELASDYEYDGVDTCAVDGMCATACPVSINTGQLVKRLRTENQNRLLAASWGAAAHAWGPGTRFGSRLLDVAAFTPTPVVRALTTTGRALLGPDTVPEYDGDLPHGGPARRKHEGVVGAPGGAPHGVYLPACVNSMFGAAGDGVGVTDAFVRLLERAGLSLVVPQGIESMCCTTPWSSKGYSRGRHTMAQRVTAALGRLADAGAEMIVISDASSCTEGFENVLRGAGLEYRVEDAVAFTAREILPRLDAPSTPLDSLMLHPTCSSSQLGLDPALRAVAEVLSDKVEIPAAWGCCGFAGDRGMLHPELTASATAAEAAEVREAQASAHASCNRTCELGMTRATGNEYRHVLELLEEATGG